MPYVGRDLSRGNYLKLDDLVSQFNGSTTTFNLTSGGSAFFPGSAFSILVSLGGIVQEPESAYTINKSQITFASAPLATDEFFIIALGVALGVGVPGHGTVGGSQLTKPLDYDDYFYLDSTNNRVGIHSSTPTVALDVIGDIKLNGNLVTAGTGGGGLNAGVVTCTGLDVNGNGDISGTLTVGGNVSIGGTLTYLDVTNIDSVGIITAQQGLESVGVITARKGVHLGVASTVGHLSTVGVSSIASLQVRDLTATHIAYAGANGRLTGSSNITYDGTTFAVAEPSQFSDNVFINVRGKSFKTSDWNIFNTTSGNALAISGGGSATEKIRINSAGEVGIGTDNPTAPLSVKVGSGGEYVLDMMGTSTKQFGLYYDQGSWNSGIFGIHEFDNSGNVSERFTINAGKVGINTTVPADLLSIGAGANTLTFGCKDTTRSNHVWQLMNNDASGNAEFRMYKNSVSGTHAQSINFATSGDANYILDGSFLLGATSVSNAENFRIHTASSDKSIMKFTNTGTGTGAGDGLEFGLNSNEHAELVLKEDKDIIFYSGATTTEKLRITSAAKTFIHGNDATGANNTTVRLNNGNTLNVHGTSSSDGISVVRYSENYGAYGINIGKSRSNTFGTNTLVQDNNELGHVSFYGADGTNFEMAAQITALVDGSPSDGTDMPGALSFRTTPDNTPSPTERLRIDALGNVSIGGGDAVPTASGYNKACLHIRQSNTGTVGSQIHLTLQDLGHASTDGFLLSHWSDKNVYFNHQEPEGDHVFYAKNASNTSIEAFRLVSTGFAHFLGANDLRLTLGSQGTAGTNTANWLRGAGTNLMYNAASGAHRWEVGGAQKLELTSGGNLNVGGNYTQTTYTMRVTGSFAATTKSFVIDHPTKENHKLRYACLEGPENSVYVRGRSSDPVIELPEYWVGLVHEDSITVNVTPIGNKKVWVESINNNSVTIGSDDSTEYFYTVFAERKDVEKLEVEVEN